MNSKNSFPQLFRSQVMHHDAGYVQRFVRVDDEYYDGFGEVYFSKVNKGKIRAWKKHLLNKLYLTVVEGIVSFVVCKGEEVSHVVNIDSNSPSVLVIPPNTIYGFSGKKRINIVASLMNQVHDPAEIVNYPSNYISFDWQ